MGNKFSQQLKKDKGDQKQKVGITDLLVDSGTDALLKRAKSEGRYLSLPADSFVPDPNQPRKSFDQKRIDELRESIEARGQLQPILVGEPLSDGRYPIIAGERRWRAISGSEKVKNVTAVIRSGDMDELQWLLIQIDENNQREQIPAIENAMAMKRVVDICKSEGQGQAYAAKILGVSPGQLSKSLALLEAPSIVAELSIQGETQDVELLYNLTKAAEGKPDEVAQLIDQWRKGELATNFRKASKELVSEAKQSKKERQEQAVAGAKAEKPRKEENAGSRPQEASAVRLSTSDDGFMLIVELGDKKLSFRVGEDAIDLLKADILKSLGG